MRKKPIRWWDTQKEAFQDWEECRAMLTLRFEGLAALQDTDMIVWSKSHLYMAPKLPMWDLKELGIIDYCGLTPEED